MKRTLIQKICKAAILVVLTGIASAQAPSDGSLSAKVDEAVTALIHQQRLPGTSLSVIRGGKVIKAKGYGLANVELNVPVTPQSVIMKRSAVR